MTFDRRQANIPSQVGGSLAYIAPPFKM